MFRCLSQYRGQIVQFPHLRKPVAIRSVSTTLNNNNSNNSTSSSTNNHPHKNSPPDYPQRSRHQDDHDDETNRRRSSNSSYWLFGTAVAVATATVTATAGLLWLDTATNRHRTWWPPLLHAATAIDLVRKRNRQQFNFVADVVEVSAPSVVYIEIKDLRRQDYVTRQPMTASNGSGFIVESDGLILTNAHVVINKPHTIVSCRLQDGRTFQGVVEDIDPASDLATVRVECRNLPAMKLGESRTARAGEWVVAMGSPLALSNTVTCGVISTTQRPSEELGLRGKGIKYIQTDAAITFGNSGGPLVNLDGEAIGINSMKVTAGISFAIPIDHAKEFLQKGIDRRRKGSGGAEVMPVRKYMGITMLTLTEDILRELRQRSHTVPDDVKHGVLVWKVILGSPAHAGGLNPGDIITHINDREVKNSQDIYEVLGQKGKSLRMSVFRGNKRLNVTVTPEDPDD